VQAAKPDGSSDVSAALRRALDGDLDGAATLLLCGAGGAHAACPPSCKGNAKRPDCVCGLVPAQGSFRKKGLWWGPAPLIIAGRHVIQRTLGTHLLS